MKCEHIRELMSIYIDNEINEVDKAKLEKHIAQCPQCKEEYELLKALVIECSDIDEVELPEGFREELHSRLIEAKNNKPNKVAEFIRKNKWKTASGAVAAVLIIAISFNSLGAPKSKDFAQSAPAESPGISSYGDRGVGESAAKGGMGIAAEPEANMAPNIAAKDLDLSFSESIGAPAYTDQSRNLITATAAPQEVKKIIKNGNVSLKVTDVQNRIQEITTLAEQNGGRVDSSYVDNISQPEIIMQDGSKTKPTTTKYANVTIRVLAERFEGVYNNILGMGELVNQSTYTTDISQQYIDTNAKVENLRVQEKRLQDIMAKAANVKDILDVEKELNRVRTEIDMLTSELKRWDSQVEYSTIYINMTEVKDPELQKVDVPGVWQKAYNGFINTLNNLKNGIEWIFVSLISILPYLLILGAGIVSAVLWIRRSKDKK